jgi:hypothetical protein
VDNRLRPQGRGEGREGGGEGRGGEEGNKCVRADASCVRTDASVLPPSNFITDATVRLSHGRPSGHRPIVRPSVCYRPHDNPDSSGIEYLTFTPTGHSIPATFRDPVTQVPTAVMRKVLTSIIDNVKSQAKG